ncbi:5-oxoprolinase subunit PxpB [Ramlibacter sp.]|uniref:5-oxoprolinase subunit PxpB n=1 Tax=Ramlibacter sp. TaxID=1917967 RepID=UPI003D0F6F4C
MRILPVNLDAVLLELDDLSRTLSVLDQLQANPIAGVEELIPGARTLLVKASSARTLAEVKESLGRIRAGARSQGSGRVVKVPVRYDGEDLDEVARIAGLSRQEVIDLHTGAEYRVAFTGFAPGFAYLTGGDARLHVPRRAVPRTRVPAGSVGLAGPFSGIYPRSSPGGWQLLGTTGLAMWDLARERPALLQPGDRVQFVAVDEASLDSIKTASFLDMPAPQGEPAFEVRKAGLQTLFQDLGRPGLAGQGVSRSGAMDRQSLRTANRLVGNEIDCTVLELFGGGLELVALRDAVLALAGADAVIELHRADGFVESLARGMPFAVCAGDIVRLKSPQAGARAYLAVRGSFDAPRVLGSCATDTLAGIGPLAIRPGDRLHVHKSRAAHIVATPDMASPPVPRSGETMTLDVVLGPRDDWFSADAMALFRGQAWDVTHESSRVGLRLRGAEPLKRNDATAQAELPSEGVMRGSIQVPPSGQPVIFMADHPLTGGYPAIAGIASHHLDLAAQLPPGSRVRFRPLPKT